MDDPEGTNEAREAHKARMSQQVLDILIALKTGAADVGPDLGMAAAELIENGDVPNARRILERG